MSKEIKELKDEIKELKQRISGLEHDLDYQVHQSNKNDVVLSCIRELQEEVAKMAKQPVGILFTWIK